VVGLLIFGSVPPVEIIASFGHRLKCHSKSNKKL